MLIIISTGQLMLSDHALSDRERRLLWFGTALRFFTPEKRTNNKLLQALRKESQIKILQEEKKLLGFTPRNL